MNRRIRTIVEHRFGLVGLMVFVAIILSLLTRIALLIKSSHEVDYSFLNVAGIFVVGLFFDLVNASYFIIPLVLYLWLTPDKLFQKKMASLGPVFYFLSFCLWPSFQCRIGMVFLG